MKRKSDLTAKTQRKEVVKREWGATRSFSQTFEFLASLRSSIFIRCLSHKWFISPDLAPRSRPHPIPIY